MAQLDLLELDLHLPLNGAWSAEVQLASDATPTPGQVAEIDVAGLVLTGRVIRAGISAERLHVRLTGGAVDWSAVQGAKHYRNTTADAVLTDVGVELDSPLGSDLAFWTRAAGTTGSTVQAVASFLGLNWRVNPDGTVRMREEDPLPVDETELVEVGRDPARGIVEVAPETAAVVPGVLVRGDSVGDVFYTQTSGGLRCRYYTQGRARIRHALERIVRWIMRDTLFHGLYTAEVIRQAADGTLDLMPADDRLRSSGLQAVPVRHGLPGVTVEVPAGELVLLGFDAGDPSQPYAALWHAGQVTRVNIGGDSFVALAELVTARLDAIQSAFDAHTHPYVDTPAGPAVTSPTLGVIGPLAPVASEVLGTR